MLRIALCDDEAPQRDYVGMLLQKYGVHHPSLAVRVSVFSSGWKLLSQVEDGEDFDIFILDMVMPEISGLLLGAKLREQGCDGAIIYLTISPEFAVDSFQVHAFYYLIKPAEKNLLFSVLDQAVAAMEKKKAACVTVKTRDGLRRIQMDSILYVELSARTLHYHLSDGHRVESLTLRGSFQEAVAPLLADSRFFQSCSSFVANLYYVIAVKNGFFQLGKDMKVPIARGLMGQARQRWSDYWLDDTPQK